jgi:NAD(P)-dependent dehydrogenase (short-subunit alcohol dehydrogenase family)
VLGHGVAEEIGIGVDQLLVKELDHPFAALRLCLGEKGLGHGRRRLGIDPYGLGKDFGLDRLPDWRVLVNSAAVFKPDTAQAIQPEIFAEAIRVNAETPTAMAQAFLAQAKSQGGKRVIQFLDQKLINTNPDFFSYTMAKHAFASTVRMLAMAQDDPATRIYGLAPGAMLPSFDQVEEEHEISGRMNLLQRLTDPAELAQAALFMAQGWLASGETIYVDSGQHLLRQPRDVLYMAREV